MNIIIGAIMAFQSDTFIKRVTIDFSLHSNYLILCIDDKKEVPVDNDNLFVYMNRYKKIKKRRYTKKIRSILKSGNCINSKEIKYETYEVYIVQEIERVSYKKKLGKEEFIDYYFKDKVFKSVFSEEEKIAVIAQLFEWKVSSSNDDETGLLMIDH